MAQLFKFVRAGWTPPAEPTESFSGQTIIVTGANTGLGFEAAVKLIEHDVSRLILGVRSLAKGEAAKAAIEQRTGEKSAKKIEVWQLDMLSYDSIRAFAQRAEKEIERLDAAVLNAGVFSVSFDQSAYGWENTLQVNVLSTALLGVLLLPKLKASAQAGKKPVLEIVGSGSHKRADITEEHRRADNLLASYNDKNTYKAGEQYGISKLFVMYVMQMLAAYAKDDVLVLTCCPGPCKSDLARGYSGFFIDLLKNFIFALVARTTEQGSRTYVSGLTLGDKAHGRFWQSDEIQEPVPLVAGTEGEELKKKVWSEVVEGLKKDVPGVQDDISRAEH